MNKKNLNKVQKVNYLIYKINCNKKKNKYNN